jgi:ribosomal protein S18 acetylase RimI-like enzyme
MGGGASGTTPRTGSTSGRAGPLSARRSLGVVPSRFATFDACHRRRDADLSVRLAGEDDLAVLAQLAEAHSGATGGWAERLGADLAGGGRALFVAEVDHAVAGYGRLRWFSPPSGSPAATAPAGWYLGGLVVATERRCRGVGAALTGARVAWVAERADEVWYYANARNAVSLALHAAAGFEEVTRDFVVPGVSFDGGVGVLCRLGLRPPHTGVDGVPVTKLSSAAILQPSLRA